MPRFTDTQTRMLDILQDGLSHSVTELKQALADELAQNQAVKIHIHYLRKKLREVGQDIICESSGHRGQGIPTQYRLVRLISDEED